MVRVPPERRGLRQPPFPGTDACGGLWKIGRHELGPGAWALALTGFATAPPGVLRSPDSPITVVRSGSFQEGPGPPNRSCSAFPAAPATARARRRSAVFAQQGRRHGTPLPSKQRQRRCNHVVFTSDMVITPCGDILPVCGWPCQCAVVGGRCARRIDAGGAPGAGVGTTRFHSGIPCRRLLPASRLRNSALDAATGCRSAGTACLGRSLSRCTCSTGRSGLPALHYPLRPAG
ncbi:hypothetical protein SAMN04487914_11121 [Arthrobacter sp. ok909]|nr:hypothetical protein SAMN04487914_11121 [Arthrobacter sp. ok909]